jgi:cytochrome c-type biogenesis protein CcmH
MPAVTLRRPGAIGVAVALGAGLALLALGLYLVLGHPYPLAPRQGAVPGIAAEASEAAPSVREQLALHLAGNPRDGRGWVLFARIEFDLDRFASAAEAYRKALEASVKVARDPGVWCEYADALAMAQGGILAGRPRELIERALAIDPGHARALEMAGSAAFEAGDFAGAARHWRLLLARLPDGTQAQREIELAAREAERRVPQASRNLTNESATRG